MKKTCVLLLLLVSIFCTGCFNLSVKAPERIDGPLIDSYIHSGNDRDKTPDKDDDYDDD